MCYSANGGRLFFKIADVDDCGTISSFASNQDGMFAFMCSHGQVSIGRLGLLETVRIRDQIATEDRGWKRAMFFDETGALYETGIGTSSSKTAMHFRTSLNDLVLGALAARAQAAPCPYKAVQAELNSSSVLPSILTPKIFIDTGDAFDLKLYVQYAEAERLSRAPIYLPLDNAHLSAVSLEYDSSVGVTDRHTHEIRLSEIGVAKRSQKRAAGELLRPTSVRLNLPGGSMACSQKNEIGVPSITSSVDLNFLSGCPPEREIRLDIDAIIQASKTHQQA